jgi:hypothetical protein
MGRGRGGFGRGRGLQSYDDNSHYGGGRNFQSQWSHPQQSGGDDGSDYSVKLTGGEDDKGGAKGSHGAGYGQYVSTTKVVFGSGTKLNYFNRITTTTAIIMVLAIKPSTINSTMQQQVQILTQRRPNLVLQLPQTIKTDLAAAVLHQEKELVLDLVREIDADHVLDPDLVTDVAEDVEELDRDPVLDHAIVIAREESSKYSSILAYSSGVVYKTDRSCKEPCKIKCSKILNLSLDLSSKKDVPLQVNVQINESEKL